MPRGKEQNIKYRYLGQLHIAIQFVTATVQHKKGLLAAKLKQRYIPVYVGYQCKYYVQ